MLHGILLILKILGIILLILLGLTLLLLCAALFAAATYQIAAEKKERFRLELKGGWLFRLLSVRYTVEQEESWKQELEFRIFGIPVRRPFAGKKEKPLKKRRKPRSAGVRERPEEASASLPPGGGKPEEALPVRERALPKPEAAPARRQETFCGRLHGWKKRAAEFLKGLLELPGRLLQRCRRLLEQKDAFLEFWNLEAHVRARAAIRRELGTLWRKLRPRRIKGKLRFGFEDPSATGGVMGALSIFYSWYPDGLELCPEFDRTVLEGEILLKGRIRLFALAVSFLRIWFNQDVRHMYRQWKERQEVFL